MSEKEENHQGTSNDEKKKADGDDEVTLGEVLRQQKELDDEYEQEYLEVLGGSDDKMCTYSQVIQSISIILRIFEFIFFNLMNMFDIQWPVAIFVLMKLMF